jgi:hypothetical protein
MPRIRECIKIGFTYLNFKMRLSKDQESQKIFITYFAENSIEEIFILVPHLTQNDVLL